MDKTDSAVQPVRKTPLFATDIDNTLICKKKPDSMGICVAVKNGENASYMSNESYDKLVKMLSMMEILPVTTRCRKSYENIYLKKFAKRALVDNGAVLVSENKEEEEEWLSWSRSVVKEHKKRFRQAGIILKSYGYREKWGSEFTLDYVNNTACSLQQKVLEDFKDILLISEPGGSHRAVLCSYKELSKGICIQRFAEKFGYDLFLSAGDSSEDESMFSKTLYSIGKKGSGAVYEFADDKSRKHDSRLFCDYVIDTADMLIRQMNENHCL